MLNGDQIEKLGIIANAEPNSYRNGTYDATVEVMLDRKGHAHSEFDLQPQEMVRVVSHESLWLPRTIGGFSLVKTELCNRGVLALNTGVLDPGYHGKVSSTLINFGRKKFHIARGDVFLRLAFFGMEEHSRAKDKTVDDDTYLSTCKSYAKKCSSGAILNIDLLAKQVSDGSIKRFKRSLFVGLPLLGLWLALCAFFVPLAISWGGKQLRIDSSAQADLAALQERVRDLEARSRSIPNMPSAPSPVSSSVPPTQSAATSSGLAPLQPAGSASQAPSALVPSQNPRIQGKRQ